MATVHERIEKFLKNGNSNPLSREQRQEVGRIIADAYWKFKNARTPIHRMDITIDSVVVKVIVYPKWFTAEIDKLISKFYHSFPENKRRKRKPVPVFSLPKK